MNYFFDIGANVGQTFDYWLNRNDHYKGWNVFCFEPSPRHLNQLIDKIQTNQTRYKITLCPFGLGKENAALPIYFKRDLAADSFDFKHDINALPEYEILSPIINTSEFILKQTNDSDNIELKIDCEGSEYDILDNLIECPEAFVRVSKLMIEWHMANNPQDKCFKQKRLVVQKLRNMNREILDWIY